MSLMPTLEEIDRLRREIDPTEKCFGALRSMLCYPHSGTMAEFYLESEGIQIMMNDYSEDNGFNLGKSVEWDDI